MTSDRPEVQQLCSKPSLLPNLPLELLLAILEHLTLEDMLSTMTVRDVLELDDGYVYIKDWISGNSKPVPIQRTQQESKLARRLVPISIWVFWVAAINSNLLIISLQDPTNCDPLVELQLFKIQDSLSGSAHAIYIATIPFYHWLNRVTVADETLIVAGAIPNQDYIHVHNLNIAFKPEWLIRKRSFVLARIGMGAFQNYSISIIDKENILLVRGIHSIFIFHVPLGTAEGTCTWSYELTIIDELNSPSISIETDPCSGRKSAIMCTGRHVHEIFLDAGSERCETRRTKIPAGAPRYWGFFYNFGAGRRIGVYRSSTYLSDPRPKFQLFPLYKENDGMRHSLMNARSYSGKLGCFELKLEHGEHILPGLLYVDEEKGTLAFVVHDRTGRSNALQIVL
ncbi:hypothetical protein C8R44DRAFT_729133 [Mycena epipterygia]|nr:hypothetical protein C8R44DRAFT_729133 [Mycena epipterygia]